ncbi:DNA-binding protein WhiA [Alloscardovia macacae]|uniref:Probable cell division protein WhiA n=1 Tax=Alloscardovia macacae TaxID=1160091 RepID=A0A1Y2SVZ3_9BIFI|nr:DNA-binding protein WhiA [Alloscardovia macacae]OTA27506.1 DNA-binding protein WhiA [Alloscardovia macacae]OTA30153.1 DNA-binding protein WhiA [Alloscardovia macacae]OZG54483.1 transcriptional regulator [Alloscardovia macacae]
MSLLDEVKNELAAITDDSSLAKQAQVSTMLRFGGGIQLVKNVPVVFAKLTNRSSAAWLKSSIMEIWGYDVELRKASSTLATGETMEYDLVAVTREGKRLALQCGLLDQRSHEITGIAPAHIQGNIAQVKAAWRGAFLAKGRLSDPGKSSMMEIVCPSVDSVNDLIMAARRLGVTAKPHRVNSSVRVRITDPDVIERMLILMGAHTTAREWSGKRVEGETRGKANRLANFDDANMRRSAKAAVEASQKVRHAFEVLGEDIPENLRAAGQLRLDHGDASLEELGRLADPPITKDAIAGRIRRLLQLATKVEKQRAANAEKN